MLWRLFRTFSARQRARRGQMFLDSFNISQETRILDLGGGTGGHIASILKGPADVTVADISESDLAQAADRGYHVTMVEDGCATTRKELHEGTMQNFQRLFGRVRSTDEVVSELEL